MVPVPVAQVLYIYIVLWRTGLLHTKSYAGLLSIVLSRIVQTLIEGTVI